MEDPMGMDIVRRAYELWEQAGMPEGMAQEFYRQAEQELRDADKSSPDDLQQTALDPRDFLGSVRFLKHRTREKVLQTLKRFVLVVRTRVVRAKRHKNQASQKRGLTKTRSHLGEFFLAGHCCRSSRSCWFASVRHAASMRMKVSLVSSSSDRWARKAQSSALSRKISAKLIPARWSGNALFQRISPMKCW